MVMLLLCDVAARRRVLCDELVLDCSDDSVRAFVDALGLELWVPVPARPGFVSRPAPWSDGYFDALVRVLRDVPAGSPVWSSFRPGVCECLGGFAGCSLRGGDGDD